MKTQLDALQSLAESSGFEVVRDDTTMIIRRSGVGYMLKTNVADSVISAMVKDAESFMTDMESIGK